VATGQPAFAWILVIKMVYVLRGVAVEKPEEASTHESAKTKQALFVTDLDL